MDVFKHGSRVAASVVLSAALSGAPAIAATPVSVVETSLGFGEQTRLLRHLGLRFGDEDFVEAHFGPGEGGSLHDGFLKYGEGKVANSEYLDVIAAGAAPVLAPAGGEQDHLISPHQNMCV